MARNRADKYTDKTFSQLESQISRMYKEAQKDINQKLLDFTKRHRAKDREMRKKRDRGEITQEQYSSWLTGQIFIGNQWRHKKEQITESIKHVMQEASNVSRGKAIDVFAENANYTAFEIEKDLGARINFGLYDAHTVSRLIRDEPELLPRKVVKGKKLEAWNQKVIANSISQGIIQGESIDEISKRIARDTCISAGRSSTLYARTAITGAQNAGRMERLHEAKDMGINVRKRWMATLDNRTRDSHAELDGETVDVDEKFSNGLMYPGDPNGAGREVYNCRCTLVYIYPEYEQHFERTAYYEEGDPEYDPDHRNYETVRDMTYEQWVEYKQNQIRQRYRTDEVDVRKPKEYSSFGYAYGESTVFPVTNDVTGEFEEHNVMVTKRASYGFPDGTATGVYATRDADVFTLDDGVEFIFPSDMDPSKQTATPELMIDRYYQLPEHYRSQIQRKVHVLDYKNPQDSRWEKEYNTPNFTSYATGGEEISFYAYKRHDAKYMVKAFAHEGAHYIDLFSPNATRISGSTEWANAMRADLAEHGFKAPTDYAKSANAEDFAESVAEYLTNKKMMETQFPYRTAIIRRVLGE